MASYALPDEPRPGRLAQWTVQPIWPLFAVMFVGSTAAWVWFLFNGFAMGSPTRRRELGIVLLGFTGAFLILVGLGTLVKSEWIDESQLRYLKEFRLFWMLGISYWLYVLQVRTFGIYEYFGGPVRNGTMGLIAAFIVWRRIAMPWFDSAAPWVGLFLS